MTSSATLERDPNHVALGVRGAVKRFGGVQALGGVDLVIGRGESVAVLGANGAGKSTVVRILTGAVHPDSGEVIVDGQPVRFKTVRDARARGIGYVPQELSVVGDLTIAENILTGGWRRRGPLVDHRGGVEVARQVCQRIGLTHSPDQLVKHLNGAERRLVMIARSLVSEPTTLILDEPTAALADREADRIVEVLNELRSAGISLVYISHRMGEIERVCDRVVVLRNGRVVMEGPADGETVTRAVALGIASGHEAIARSESDREGESVSAAADRSVLALRCRGLTNRAIRDIDLEVREGEVIGLAGLLGSGRTEILRALAGADRVHGGTIERKGEVVSFRSPIDAIHAGIALLPEDRRNQGGLLSLTVRENLVLPKIPANRFGWLHRRAERRMTSEAIGTYGVRCSSVEAQLHTLSGGNQQKVILGRWLLRGIDVLLLDEPTAGIDVVAKRELMNLVRSIVRAGGAAIVASSELDELTEYCDRIYVVRDGRVHDEVVGHISVADLARLCDQADSNAA